MTLSTSQKTWRVTNTNIGIAGENGLLGEVDVVTETALIQYKDGGASAKKVIDQVTLRTEAYVDRPVVTFINGVGRDAARTSATPDVTS